MIVDFHKDAPVGPPASMKLARAEVMDWNEIRTLAKETLATVGANTMTHPALARLPGAEVLGRDGDVPYFIRGDLGRDWGVKVQQNIVHGSDSAESADREIAVWFPSLGTA